MRDMIKMFKAVKVNGKLVARDIKTNELAPEGLIRQVQIRTAAKTGELLVVSPTGRVSRMPQASEETGTTKMQFMSHIQSRDPKEMFGNLERLTKMVGRAIQPSLLVTGMPGLGKTFIVKKTLEDMGLVESKDFVHFKGRATAAGMFITLYENSDKIVVFDDCDSIFKDTDAVNILKGALDSYDSRKISYITSKPLKDEDGLPLPRHFEFTGQIIFISNIAQSNLDDAIKSRSFVADISMNVDQTFKRIEELIDKLETRIPLEAKQKALDIMKAVNDKYTGVEINMRSFIKAARICAMGFDDAETLIAEQIISQ
jgi:hypothetical protein